MRKALRILIVLTVSLSSLDALAESADANFEMIADYGGKIAAWRLIPGTLLARCSKEAPQNEQALRGVYTSWSQANNALISGIDKVIDQVSPTFAKAMKVDDTEAKTRLIEFTTSEITDTYFRNPNVSVTQVCADYEKIVAGLSSPGRIATIRGFMYSVEGLVTNGTRK